MNNVLIGLVVERARARRRQNIGRNCAAVQSFKCKLYIVNSVFCRCRCFSLSFFYDVFPFFRGREN